jgi:hypothetical protein
MLQQPTSNSRLSFDEFKQEVLHDYRLAAIDNLTYLLQIRHDPGRVVAQLEASMRELAALDCLELLA